MGVVIKIRPRQNFKNRSRLSKDIAVEHKPHHSEVRKLFKTIYCMPKRFLSHNRASVLLDHIVCGRTVHADFFMVVCATLISLPMLAQR